MQCIPPPVFISEVHILEYSDLYKINKKEDWFF